MNIGILAVDSNFPNLVLTTKQEAIKWNGIIHYVNMIKYMQLKFSLSHPTKLLYQC